MSMLFIGKDVSQKMDEVLNKTIKFKMAVDAMVAVFYLGYS